MKQSNVPVLTDEQKSFDVRVAQEVMGWRRLDDGLEIDFHNHVLPASSYPFFETLDNGIVTYHPSPYHTQMFSPSVCAEDDIATFVALLGGQSSSMEAALSMLHFIHHQRAMRDAAFQPSDEYYRVSRYYKPGDFATLSLHLLETENARRVKRKFRAEHERVYIGHHGIADIIVEQGIMTVKCKDALAIPQSVLDDFGSHGLPVHFQTIEPE